ncbi:MAG: N-acetyltransferase [Candidatus Delongbacteria bacterium]|nr:N-acetyltransferase [Candidatus Delongbacteria bacterium]
MEIRIVSVDQRKAMKQFMALPWEIYREDTHWAPPLIQDIELRLDRKRNPFFEHAEAEFLLAYDERGACQGRIAVLIDRLHNEFHHEKTGFWGFFECRNDSRISDALFTKAAEWLRQRGMNRMRGPMSFGTNDECGMLMEGFDSHACIMMPYNPPYYLDLCGRFGMQKAKDLIAFYLDVSKPVPEKVMRIADYVKTRMEKKGFSIRYFDKKNARRDIEQIMEIYRTAWKDNWGYVPITEKEISVLAKNLVLISHERLIMFIMDHDKPVAVTGSVFDLMEVTYALRRFKRWPLWIQSLLQLMVLGWRIYLKPYPKFNWGRMLIAGILPEYRQSGIDSLLYVIPFDNGRRLGLQHGELSWELEDNVMINKAIEKVGGVVYKKYRIWDFDL